MVRKKGWSEMDSRIAFKKLRDAYTVFNKTSGKSPRARGLLRVGGSARSHGQHPAASHDQPSGPTTVQEQMGPPRAWR
jgi:hypothetical protein